ncbi:MAG: CRISPR system precrRNA processing endoribonuclease RAMP protein Cas6, partial [bacterium]
ILIGRAIDYLPYFIYTFERMGEIGLGRGRGKFCIVEVKDGLGDGRLIYSGAEKTLTSNYTVLNGLSTLEQGGRDHSEITLNFLTPTRIKYGRKYIDRLEFHVLMRNLLRRISLLYEFHCGGRVDFDYKGLIAEAAGISVKDSDLYWYQPRFSFLGVGKR